MKYYNGSFEGKLNNTIVTIGKFDGLHKGHQRLINEINKHKKKGDTSVLVTFGQFDNMEYIYTEEEKKNIVSNLGIDVMIVYSFDEKFKNIEAIEFVKDILVGKLGAKMIIVGSDFHFGKDRKGDKEFLIKLSKHYNYEVIVCEKEKNSDKEEISSTIIREYIKNSKMKKVSEALGRNYSISGTVVKGRQIGRTIGFPTINLNLNSNKIMPSNGVYKSEVIFRQNKNIHKLDSQMLDEPNMDKIYKGLTNIGNRPTIASGLEKNVETFIFDFNNDVYGREVTIYIEDYIRPEKKFESIEELKETLKNDKSQVIF